MKINKWFNIALILELVLLVSCIKGQPKLPIPAPTISISSALPTNTAPILASMTVSPTQVPDLDLSGLSNGQYIIYTYTFFEGDTADSSVDFQLVLQSLEGKNERVLMRTQYKMDGATPLIVLSSSQKHLIIFNYAPNLTTGGILSSDPVMFNLQTRQFEPVPPYPQKCWNLSLSPDAKSWIGECGDIANYEIFFQNGDQQVRVTNCHSLGDECHSPTWSPDGKWISYFRRKVPVGGGLNSADGLLLVSSDCVLIQNGCMENPVGFNGWQNYAWSPDSNYIATSFIPGYDPISIYKFFNNKLVLEKKFTNTPGLFFGGPLVWSSDGQSIAFSDSTNIYIVDVTGGTQKLLIQRDAPVQLIGIVQLESKITP
jgi:hypothetical protein